MSDKITLPRRIEMRDAIYTLAYVPGTDEYIEPNFQAMQPAAADCTLVTLGGQRKWMSWVMMDAPARIGSATPPRRFLLFRLYDQPMRPMPEMFPDMIAYMMSPIEQGGSPAQLFLNALVGRREEDLRKRMPRDDWAQKMFTIAPENAGTDMPQNSEESAYTGEEVVEAEIISPEQ